MGVAAPPSTATVSVSPPVKLLKVPPVPVTDPAVPAKVAVTLPVPLGLKMNVCAGAMLNGPLALPCR